MSIILDEVIALIKCNSASIAIIDPDTRELKIEVCHGLPDNYDQVHISLQEGITGWVAMHGRPLLISDIRNDHRYVPIRESVLSEMAVPLISDDNVVGVINVDSDQLNAFSSAQLDDLQKIALETTLIINRLWQLEQLSSKAAHLESLISTSRGIASQHDLAQILENITHEGRRLMDCKACAIFMTSEDGSKLHLETLSGLSEDLEYSEEFAVADSTLGVAIARCKQVEVGNLPRTEEHHFVPLIQSANLVSMLATPIVAEGSAIGILNAYTDHSHRFNNDEKRLMEALAGLGGVAIQNARLYARIFTTEESLRKNERLTTLGLLAAEIAHEVRNPLTVVKLLFQSLNLQFDEDDPRNRDMTVITEKLHQLEDTVGNVLNFGKSNQTLHTSIDLNSIVEDTLLLVRLKLQQQEIEISSILEPDALIVDANKGQIQQALLNLILNSVHAMPNGGKIEIRTGRFKDEQESCPHLIIKDTGSGIPEDIQPHIFTSLFSGREGSGLGLNIVKRILKSHRGDVELLETSAKGTTFRLWLPMPQ